MLLKVLKSTVTKNISWEHVTKCLKFPKSLMMLSLLQSSCHTPLHHLAVVMSVLVVLLKVFFPLGSIGTQQAGELRFHSAFKLDMTLKMSFVPVSSLAGFTAEDVLRV